MRKSAKTIQEQESIIAEYLLGDATNGNLGAKYAVNFRLIPHKGSKILRKTGKEDKTQKQTG